MKKIFWLILALNTAIFAFAQNDGEIVQTIKGKVIDKATNNSVSYTNIGLEGTFHGTASNENGNFELKIPAAMVDKNIYFSAVGYKNLQFPVRNLFDKEFSIIKMESQSYGIDDIDIAAQSKVLQRILRVAAENIPVNYIDGPFNLNCSYSKQTTIDTSTSNFTASVLIFDNNGYSHPSKTDAYKEINYSVSNASNTEYRFTDQKINIDELLEFDWVRTGASVLNPGLLNAFRLKLLSQPKIDGNDYWEISFEQKEPGYIGLGNFYTTSFTGSILIGKIDYEIKSIKGTVRSSKNSRQGISLAVTNTNNNTLLNVTTKFEISYKNLVPEKISITKTYLTDSVKTNEKIELKVNGVKTTALTKIDKRYYFISE